MRSLILYIPDGVTLDLDKADLGHPDGYEIIQRHHRQSVRKGMGFNRANPAFACLTHIGSTNPGLFIKNIDGEWWAAHYERGACASRRIPAPMSDEHKRQTEYWVRAAGDAGWSAETEHALPTGTRPDALIFGNVLTGIEVQRSAMTAAGASARTRKALAAGVTDIWYTGDDVRFVGGKLSPRWAHRVPTLGSVVLPWTALPPRRAATATGMRHVEAIRCDGRTFALCAETGRRPCGKWHAHPSPWTGMTVDDVAARFPAGEIVPLRFRKNSRSGDVFLVSTQSAALYEELTGFRAAEPVAPVPPPLVPASRTECVSPQTQAPLPLYVPVAQGSGFRDFAPAGRQQLRRVTAGLCEDGRACGGTAKPGGTWTVCQACRLTRRLAGES